MLVLSKETSSLVSDSVPLCRIPLGVAILVLSRRESPSVLDSKSSLALDSMSSSCLTPCLPIVSDHVILLSCSILSLKSSSHVRVAVVKLLSEILVMTISDNKQSSLGLVLNLVADVSDGDL